MSRGNSSRRRARREAQQAVKQAAKKRRREKQRMAEVRERRNRNWDKLTTREKMCDTKKKYATRDAAQHDIVSRARHTSKPLRAYECPYCGGWHITSQVLPDDDDTDGSGGGGK